MKIVINAYQYSPNITGTDRMARAFIDTLQSLDKKNHYIILCSNIAYTRSSITTDNFTILSPPKLPMQRIVSKLWRTFIPLRVLFLKADVYLSFHNMQLPRLRLAKRMLAYNLDIIPAVLEGYAEAQGQNKRSIIKKYRRVINKADHLVSISHFSKSELIHYLNAPANKITVVPLAVDEKFWTEKSNNQFLLPDSFLLTLGGSEPRKNVQMVIDSFALLPAKFQEKHPLYIVGGNWKGKTLDLPKKSKHIHNLGYIPDEDLRALYNNATLFIFASTYEGFGFTVLEAMAGGAPVLGANASSIPEVAAGAATLFDPDDKSTLSTLISSTTKDPQRRALLSSMGSERLSHYSWKKSTEQLLDIITNIAKDKP